MAKDDMDVIIYKILRYLYRALKAGKKPELNDMCYHSELFVIPENYWYLIMQELIESGYVRGFEFRETKDKPVITVLDSAGITLKGVQFLEENSQMQKVKGLLGVGFEIVLDAVLSSL